MGFATLPEKKKIKPRYKNTLVCQECGTEFGANVTFVRGISEIRGTDFERFTPLTKIEKGTCPMCSNNV